MTRYVKREIAAKVLEALEQMPVVVISGLRQAGKSTFLQKQDGVRNRRYVTLDDFAYLEAAKQNPDAFVQSEDPVTIDEVQRCPELLVAIKRAVDKDRAPGKYLLSGSSSLSVLKGVSESLAGRAVYFSMYPFSRRELAGDTTKKPFLSAFFEKQSIAGIRGAVRLLPGDVLKGGMPSICLDGVRNKALWFKGYEQTYLERDVREMSQIGNIISFRQLLRLAALRTAQLLSPSQLGRDAKLNTATTMRYLSMLEASFVIHRLSPYIRNRASRLIKSPKLYVADSGLACYLAGINSLESEPFSGAMFETYVAQNLFAIVETGIEDAGLYFWNVQGRQEVDFIIEAGNKCIAIEMKAGARWENKDLSGLKAFLASTPHCVAGILAYNGTESVKLDEKIWAIPLSVVLT
ncbi:MAG: ATP-binding protein [Deltaproteobacteria bacterium]|nr:ATP-binding protein [Deltaproteobacteria bacterium]MCL5277198.1 ATP-binding protein [Deltaproteobacteria bacterium]